MSIFHPFSARLESPTEGDFSRPREGIVPQKQQIVEHSGGVCFNL
jgi:hypothetical protein